MCLYVYCVSPTGKCRQSENARTPRRERARPFRVPRFLRKKTAAFSGRQFLKNARLALAELRCAAGGFEAVLYEIQSQKVLIFQGFLAFSQAVIPPSSPACQGGFRHFCRLQRHHLLSVGDLRAYCTSICSRYPSLFWNSHALQGIAPSLDQHRRKSNL